MSDNIYICSHDSKSFFLGILVILYLKKQSGMYGTIVRNGSRICLPQNNSIWTFDSEKDSKLELSLSHANWLCITLSTHIQQDNSVHFRGCSTHTNSFVGSSATVVTSRTVAVEQLFHLCKICDHLVNKLRSSP